MIELVRDMRKVDSAIVVADRWIAIETNRGLDSIALELSRKIEKGYLILGSANIVWMDGKKATYISKLGDLPEIEAAQEVFRKYTGEEVAPRSVSSCGRAMLKAFNAKNRVSVYGSGDKMLGVTGWHALVAKPGRYEEMTMFDMKGAYWQLAQRAPSPFVNIIGDRVSFVRVGDRIEQEWRELLEAMSKHKLMRNGFIGAMASTKNRIYQRGGIYKRNPMPRSPLFNFAATVVASCYEICSEASKSVDSVYTHTDCVAYNGELPKIWSNKGIVADKKAKGYSVIISVGCRKIGEDRTETYKDHESGRVIFRKKEMDTTRDNYSGLLYSRWVRDL